MTNPHVALLFMIPGLDETLRVHGTAELVTDPDLARARRRRRQAGQGHGRRDRRRGLPPLRQGAAERRAVVTDRGCQRRTLPSGSCIFKDHLGLDVDVAVIEADRNRDLRSVCGSPAATRD